MTTLALLSIFALIFLAIGLYASRGISNFKGYILAQNIYGSFALTATIVASFVGGGFFIGTIEKTYEMGLAPAFALFGFTLQLILTGYLICSRKERFKDCYSVGDIIRTSYGKKAQIFTGLLWMSFSVGIVTAQFVAMGNVLTMFVDLNYGLCVLLASAIVITYCLFGGIRAVVATDVLQFLLIFVILLIGLFTFFGMEAAEHDFLSLYTSQILAMPGSWGWSALFFAFFGFLFGDALIAPVIQRIIMAKSATQAKTSFIVAGLITIPLCLAATTIGLYTASIAPDLKPSEALPFFLSKNFSGLSEALIVTALMAVIISSADTYLNSAASVLVNDVVLPLSSNLKDNTLLNASRLFTLLIGVCAVSFALFATNIFDLLLYTYKFWGPIILVPLTYAFYGTHLTEKDFFIISASGAFTVFAWNAFGLEKIFGANDLFAGLLASTLCFSFVHGRKKQQKLTA